jgi:SAM-dependent methyltransferase
MPTPPELDGYRYDLEYNHDYHRELSPAFLRLLVRTRGAEFPDARPLRYLELGYGTGVPLNIHAAAAPGDYWGTDISAAHAGSARTLANASGAGIELHNLSFGDLSKRTDLAQFDIIVAHGVWSWVSPDNRALIVELLKRHLGDGGLFFMSAVAMPAEAEAVPLQRLLRAQRPAQPRQALDLAYALQAVGSPYFASDTRAGRRLASLKDATANYLVHEYLHEHWHPCLFADTAATLATAGLRFVAGTRLLDQFDESNFSPEQCALLRTIEDETLRETARDFLRMRRQRYDVFMKGGSSGPGQSKDQPFVLTVPAFAAAAADAHGKEIVSFLAADDYRPKLLPQAERAALFALIDSGAVLPVQPRPLGERAAPACMRLNAEILRRSLTDDTIGVLASPVTGSGIPLSRLQRLFLLAWHDGARSPDAWAAFAQRILSTEAAHLMKEALFFQTRLPCLRALGLLDQT